MSNAAVLKQIGIESNEGVISGVQKVGAFIEGLDNHLSAANSIIVGLGGRPEDNSDRARIVAKTMVSQVLGKRKADQTAAQAKADAMLAKEPYFKRDEINAAKAEKQEARVARPTKTGRRKGANNDKHAKADAFVQANKDKYTDRGELVRATAAHLGTDYAGAYFYVKKAEKKFGLQLTARKGRKPKVKVAE